MDTGDAAGGGEMSEDAIGLDHEVLTVADFHFLAYDGIDKGQFGEATIEEVGQRLEDLTESRSLDKHTMEDAILGIGLRVLLDTSTGVRAVGDIHGEEQVVDHLLAIYAQDDMFGLMAQDGGDEAEEVVDVVGADIVLETLGILAAEGIDAEANRVDEVAMLFLAVAPVGEAADVDGMRCALEEAAQGVFVLLGERPITPPIVTRATRHESELYLGALFGRDVGGHDAIHHLGERTVAAEHEQFVVAAFAEFASQFSSMTGVLGDAVGEGQVALTEKMPEVDTLCAEGALTGFGIDDDAEHGIVEFRIQNSDFRFQHKRKRTNLV